MTIATKLRQKGTETKFEQENISEGRRHRKFTYFRPPDFGAEILLRHKDLQGKTRRWLQGKTNIYCIEDMTDCVDL